MDVDGTKGEIGTRCAYFYKDAVRESDSPFRQVNKEIYKVTNLGI